MKWSSIYCYTVPLTFFNIGSCICQVIHDQPLVVAVSRTAHSGAPVPSPVTPLDAAGQLLLPVRPGGIISATCHATAVPAPGVVTQPVSARAPLTVDTAVPTTMLPLGVVVTTDVPSSAALNKVRHMSPELAKSLLQQSGL